MPSRRIKRFLHSFWKRFNEHDLFTLAAALAFYTALSLAPLLLITTSILGLLGPHTQKQFVDQIEIVIGSQAGEAVKLVIEGAKDRPDLSKVGGFIGLAVLLFSASSVFSQLQSSLNLIWDASGEGLTFRTWIKRRLISMGMVLSLGFLSMVSLVVTTVLSFLLPSTGDIWQWLNQVITLAIFTVLFGAIYKILPDAKLSWRNAFKGSFVTAVLFTLGKLLIGLYLGKSAVGSAYGATGSLIVFLVWVYYSSFILFIGAEITALLSFEESPAKLAK